MYSFNWTKLLAFGFLVNSLTSASVIPKEISCGYDSCPKPKPDMLNVHIVCHSHDDLGWLKTIDQYFYGSNASIQNAGVQYILDSVVEELLKDPNRKFIQVETAFLMQWYEAQSNENRLKLVKLVEEGRLEIVGGAWSMNDEANTNYQSIIDQTTLGFHELYGIFGKCGRPRVGWQIDPFGHSREQASIFAQFGYDGEFLVRIDTRDKVARRQNKTLEMVWHGSANLGKDADLFTSVLYDHYSVTGFRFDFRWDDQDNIVDDKNSAEYNLDRRLAQFKDYLYKLNSSFVTNNLLFPMGDDFTYMAAHMWYKNVDKLIYHINEEQKNGGKINAFYSTPSCYLKALNDANITWTSKSDDFFPYSMDKNRYWSGYYTSRPTQKRFERLGNHLLHVTNAIASTVYFQWSRYKNNVNSLKREMAVMQHHDAITGTEQQHVANNYAKRLSTAIENCQATNSEILNYLTSRNYSTFEAFKDSKQKIEFQHCLSLNISECAIPDRNESFILTVFNVLSYPTNQYVRIPVMTSNYYVVDESKPYIPSVVIDLNDYTRNLKFRKGKTNKELVFLAENLPALGYKSYFISKNQSNDMVLPTEAKTNSNNNKILTNKYYNLTFDESGKLKSIQANGVTANVNQSFWYYEGKFDKSGSSGAYVFRPNGTAKPLSESIKIDKIVKTDIVQEVHQTINEWAKLIIRLYHEENNIEFEWLIGPISIADGIGKELILRFDTDIESGDIFHTDSNGREMMTRTRNKQSTWNLDCDEPVACNYYPVSSQISIEDKTRVFAILSDRAHGGSSLKSGSIEIMLHRRLLHDDGYGVAEALNETAYGEGLIVSGKTFVIFGSTSEVITLSKKAAIRLIQMEKLLPIWMFFSETNGRDHSGWRHSFKNGSFLAKPLPANIHLMNYDPWNETKILIRLEHIFEKNEDTEYSKPQIINLFEIFATLPVRTFTEVSLDGNELKSDNIKNRLKWKTSDPVMDGVTDNTPFNAERVVMNPMQIRTFIIDLNAQ